MIQVHPTVNAVFIGAGPAGLWSAVQAKLRFPHLNVHLLDKRDAYARTHILKIDRSSFIGCVNDPRLRAIVKKWLREPQVRVNQIEGDLSALAEEIGIVFRRNVNVEDPREILREYPNARVVVGADGAHSTVRETIFENAMVYQKNLKYLFELKYEVQGRGAPLRLIKQVYPALKVMQSIATEHVGKEKESKSQIALRILIDQERYERLQEATFRHPYTFQHEELIGQQLMKNIRIWLNIKRMHGEIRLAGSEKITATRLGYYASRHVVKKEGAVTWCLLGDAAFGVPFFRSLNNAFLEGTQLAKNIGESFVPARCSKKQPPLDPFSRYSIFVKSLARWEIAAARVKNFFINCLLWFVKLSARVPWQSNYWTEGQVQVFEAEPVV